MEMGVPIFNGRIDKTLFASSLRSITEPGKSSPDRLRPPPAGGPRQQ